MPDDEFIANRIRWRASKHGLPAHYTYGISDVSKIVRSSINNSCRDYDIGTPVLVFGNASERWTVLGTYGVISYYDQTAHYCVLMLMADFDAGMPRVPKQEMEYLNVTLKDSSVVRLWGPCGSQFFALWNILVGLSQMNLTDDSQ